MCICLFLQFDVYVCLQVVATDRNDTGMSSFADVIIKVKDINDNTPFFKSDSTFTVNQNARVGTKVGKVTAIDDDITETNNRVIYLLRSGGFGKFSIDFETGGGLENSSICIQTPATGFLPLCPFDTS